jgi:hypothetical protein
VNSGSGSEATPTTNFGPAHSAGFIVPALLVDHGLKEQRREVYHQNRLGRHSGLCRAESRTKWVSWSTAKMAPPASPRQVDAIPMGKTKTENINKINDLWR